MKVFGIGFHKTGTSSFAAAMRRLGFCHRGSSLELMRCIARGDLEPVFDVADRFDSFDDWPWPLVYRELDERYPGSKFVLTTRRDSETWFDSLRAHALRRGPSVNRKIVYGYSFPLGRRAHHIARYEAHNDPVRTYFHARSDDFREVCWENGDGWKTLCALLGKEVPGEPFPHENRIGDLTIALTCRRWAVSVQRYLTYR